VRTLIDSLFQPTQGATDTPIVTLALALLIAFIIGQLNAWCYKWTHRGVSYSRTFTQALVLITLLGALTMTMVVHNIVAAFGLLGGMAIIRYRTVVRDARDTAYIFLCLVSGMAAGFGFYLGAVAGSVMINAVMFYLHLTAFGAWRSMETLLRFQVDAAGMQSTMVETVLKRYCRRVSLVSVDEEGMGEAGGVQRYQYTYKLRLRRPERAADLVSDLRTSLDTTAVHLLVDQEHEEVS